MLGTCCTNEADGDSEHVTIDPGAYYNVMVVGARGIRNTDWLPGLGMPDCYCEVIAMGEDAQEEPLFVTKVLDDTLEPMWREEAPLVQYKVNQGLRFKIWDKDVVGSDYLGKVELEAGYFGKDGFNGELPLEEAGDGINAYLRFKIKPPRKPYPSPASPTFEIEVERNSKEESWGLALDLQDDRHLFITDIMTGPIQKYNDELDNDDLKVNTTDFITSVNGSTTQIIDELRAAMKATITIQRGLDIKMIIEKGEKDLKSSFPRRNASDGGLVVKLIADGSFIKDYNDKTEDPNLRFQVNDRIMSVDGQTGNSLELHRMMQHAQGNIHVSVIRCSTCDGKFPGSETANRWAYYD